MNTKTKDNILNFVSDNDLGCSSREISNNLNLDRITLTKYLDVLYSEGILSYKRIGMAKLWYTEKSPVLNAFANTNNGTLLKELFNNFDVGVMIINQNREIVWVNSKISKIHSAKIKGKNIHKIRYFCEETECNLSEVFEKGISMTCLLEKKEITHFPINDKKGNVNGAVSIIKEL